jgi:hypothetical protein
MPSLHLDSPDLSDAEAGGCEPSIVLDGAPARARSRIGARVAR